MSRLERARVAGIDPAVVVPVKASNPAYQAYQILHWGFTVLPIVAGLDKFFDLLVPWHQYLAPIINRLVPVDAHTFLMGVGAIEIVAGLILAFGPKVGGQPVMAWLWGVIVYLVLIPGYYDNALPAFGPSPGAPCLSRTAVP